MDNYSRVILTIIAVCLLYVSFRLYTVSIFDFVPTPKQMLALSKKDPKKFDEQMSKIDIITQWIITDGINNAGTLDVQVQGGEIEVSSGDVNISGGEIDCNIVQ